MAATGPLKRIERDLARASWRAAPVLRHFRKTAVLFDEDLQLPQVLRATKQETTQAAVEAELEELTGLTIMKYLQALRLDAAEALLLETDLGITLIVEVTGFRSLNHLGGAFKSLHGIPPSGYRRQGPAVLAAPRAAREAPARTPVGKESRHRLALEIWRELREQPPEAWGEKVRHHFSFRGQELFFVLGEAYLAESRKDRQRGVAVAELARVVLDASAAAFGEEIHDRRAQASAWVGNAKRLALDLQGADAEMARAEAELKVPRERWDRHVRAQIISLKGALRLSQRRFDEALDLSNEAIALSRSAGAFRLLAQSLVVRVSVILYSGHKESTVSEAAEARRIAKQLGDHCLMMAAYSNHAMALIVAGEPEKALCILQEAELLDKEVGYELFHYQLILLTGVANREQGDLATAERLLQEARDGFNSLHEADHMAVVSIELAIVHARQGRYSEVLRLVSDALPIFQALQADPEAVSALRLLREAIEHSQVTVDVLERTRASLRLVQVAPVPSRPAPRS